MADNVRSVFRDQAISTHPFCITGDEGVAALESLSNIPLSEFKRYAPTFIYRDLQRVQIGINFGHLLRQKMSAYFVENGTADAEQILFSVRGDVLQHIDADRLRVSAEGEHVLIGIKDEAQGIRAKVPRASS